MYLVILETSTQHFSENPKDQTKITEFFYQIIDTESYECTFEKVQSLKVDDALPDGLQQVMNQLEKVIKEHMKDAEIIYCSMFSTWTLRVILKRQAYDENVILPDSMQHLKIFDLWKEYGKYYLNHKDEFTSDNDEVDENLNTEVVKSDDPEYTRFTNMLNILNISPEDLYKMSKDEKDSQAENDDIDPSQELSNDASKFNSKFDTTLNSLRNINTTIELLLLLLKLCKDNEKDLKSVLIHPYNLNLDLTTFQDEKSTILYMTNLPSDTTQSELESWFTQYGTRPVGFWTFRNILDNVSTSPNIWELNQYSYVEELNSIPGFVIFQTHEDAMQALTILNGRSMLSNVANTKQPCVVEHIIELQPSSNSVIDSAQEILVPFPQSKNKPRPGDWHCPSCGFLNFQRRTACFRCSFPIPLSFQKVKNNGNNRNNGDNGLNDSLNLDKNTTAEGNNIDIDQSKITPNLNSSEHNNNNTNNNGLFDINQKMKQMNTSFRHTNNNNNNGYSSIPFRAGDWKCGVCDYHNFAKNIVCLRCGGPKTSNTNSRDSLNKITKNVNTKSLYHGDKDSKNALK